MSKHFYGAVLMGAILIPVSVQGCSSDNPLCCTEFKPGIEITGAIGGSVQSQVAIQAVADFSGIASAAVDDLTSACQRMAADLDATPEQIQTEAAKTDPDERLSGMCALAVGQIKAAIQVAGTLKVNYQPPACSASFSAKASCDAKCNVNAPKCDYKVAANLPTCEGGKLEVSCKGSCKAKAGATLSCTGSCDANCEGSCQATGGVRCAGKCEGKCSAGAEAGETGAQADGTCKGKCEGTCSVTPPGVQCSGSCQGSCSGECKGTAEASVKCDGECTGDVEPLRCQGGSLKASASCSPPSASCSGSCDASVKAKAECTPPSVSVDFSAQGSANVAGKLKATLEANFGVVLAFSARLKGMADIGGSFTANISAVTDIKAACIPVVVAQIGTSTKSLANSVSVTGSLVGSVTGS